MELDIWEQNFVDNCSNNNGLVQSYIALIYIYMYMYSGRKVSLDKIWLLGKTNNFNRFVEILKYLQDSK